MILPTLPPPPKIPNLFALAGLADVLNILKMISKMLCVLKNLPIAPENKVGERIAQITDRKGFHLLDFLSLDVPNIQVSSIDAIKITSYINYKFKFTDIADYTEKVLEPLNETGIRATRTLNTQINDAGISKPIDLSNTLDGVNNVIDKVNEKAGEDIELPNGQDKINLIKPIAEETMARIDTIQKHASTLS